MNRSIIGYSPEIVLSNRCQLVCPQASHDAMPKIIDTPISIALCPAHSFSLFSYQSPSLFLSSSALPSLAALPSYLLICLNCARTVAALIRRSIVAQFAHSHSECQKCLHTK